MKTKTTKKSTKRPITFRFTGEQEKQLRHLASRFGSTMQSTIIQLVTTASPRALQGARKKREAVERKAAG